MMLSGPIRLLIVALGLTTAVAARHNGNQSGNQNGSPTFSNSTNNAGSSASAVASSASSSTAASSTTNNGNSEANANNADSASLTLEANAVQTGSQQNGLANAEAGQAASDTDNANFINFCAGKTLTNGLQVAGGSCNGIVMGDIPSSGNMISMIITNPGPGDNIAANQTFNVTVQSANLEAGSFTNPDTTYYAAPQQLQNGNVVGHTHITIQTLGNDIATTTPPDAATFAFFKGINDAGNGNGGLSAEVTGGLSPGVYRVCTMTSASNHQPVTMPLAQRGSQDDCTKFTVSENGAAASGSTGSGNAGGAAAASAGASASSSTGDGNDGASNASSASVASTAATAASGNQNGNSGSNSAASSTATASSGQSGSGRNGGGRQRGQRFAKRAFIA